MNTDTHISAQLDALVKSRYHGAANVSGIRYQVLYSTLRVMDLCDNKSHVHKVMLECIEDLDVVRLQAGSTYVQVKSSANSWSWSRLREPMEHFVEVMRIDPDAHFELVVNFTPRDSLSRLARIRELSKKDKLQVHRMLRKLCKNVDMSASEAELLASRLILTSLPEEKVWQLLRRAASKAFNLNSDAVEIHICVLVARVLDWAANRDQVVRADIDRVYADVSEKLARQNDFDAYGAGLITRISWDADANPLDFFEGKGTRPGHITAGVDVIRSEWMQRIDEALASNSVCVIRSASGQGKSTLAYRYARTHWSAENTFIVRVAREPEQVERILHYIDFQCSLGLPILVLVDGADWRTSLWPTIAQAAMSRGAYVLVTVRMEDWHRFSRESNLTYRLIEPYLSLEEAKEVFVSFQAQDKIHSSVDSAEWAYEKIGELHLLMEYVYFITHGKMLQERLSDQMKAFDKLDEDPAKIEMLRRTALADSFGVTIDVRELLNTIQFAKDPQQVLASLMGEYVACEDGQIRGLHQVRSEHLVELLHGDYPSLTDTAVKTIDAIPLDGLTTFTANAICRGGIERGPLLAALAQKAIGARLTTILAILQGLFQGGEARAVQINQDLFDAAFELAGSAGPFLLGLGFSPTARVDTINDMLTIFADSPEKAGAFPALKDLALRFRPGERGLDICKGFLDEVCVRIPGDTLTSDIQNLGDFLDWCALSGADIAAWPSICGGLVGASSVFDLSLAVFCSFAQGLYRYDEPLYRDWLDKNRNQIIGYLKVQTDSVVIDLSETDIYVEFFIDHTGDERLNSQAVSRLEVFRSVFPFCQCFKSQGLWLLPDDMMPPMDETHKEIPQNSLPLRSDVKKNVVWKELFGAKYTADSYYRYQELWYGIRCDALSFVRALGKMARRTISGKRYDLNRALDNGELTVRLFESMQKALEPPQQAPEIVESALKNAVSGFSSHLQNFLQQLVQYYGEKDPHTGRLCIINFKDVVAVLPDLHAAFDELFRISSDYFCATNLNAQEIEAYESLAELLEVWMLDPPALPQSNPLHYVRAKRDTQARALLNKVKESLAEVNDDQTSIILPIKPHMDGRLTHIPVAYSVQNMYQLDTSFIPLASALAGAEDAADFFYFIPVREGKRLIDKAYRVASHNLEEIAGGRTETFHIFIPVDVPDEVMALLPHMDVETPVELQAYLGIANILLALQSMTALIGILYPLLHSEDAWDLVLYDRHEGKLLQLCDDIGRAAAETISLLESAFPTRQDDPHYLRLSRFLMGLSLMIEKQDQNGVTVLDEFEPEDLETAINHLFQDRT